MIQKQIGISTLSASDVLMWATLNGDKYNKEVRDLSETQNLLIERLRQVVNPQCKYLLDGHFCLLTTTGKIEPVPIETFRQISPILLSVMICNPQTIINRLKTRDQKNYSIETISKMQKMEIKNAQLVSEKLGIELVMIEGDETELIQKIKSL